MQSVVTKSAEVPEDPEKHQKSTYRVGKHDAFHLIANCSAVSCVVVLLCYVLLLYFNLLSWYSSKLVPSAEGRRLP